jgi:non-specific serine/threonine protein kinase
MAVNLDGRLVVMGGWAQQGGDPTAEVSGEVLVLGDGGWEPLAPLRHPRAAGAAAVVDGQIVVVGGQRDNELVLPTEIYDPEADEWREGAPIPTPREHVAAGAFDGSLYAVGGRALGPDRNLDVLERYDVASDTWEQLEPMPTPRGSVGATVAHGRLVVVGGETSTGVLDTIELYDFATGTWSAGPPLEIPRHGAAAATRGPVVYVIGGAERTLHRGSSTVTEALDFK